MNRDRGSASLELVLLTPVLLVIFMLIVMGGRYAQARADVDSAARDAARAGSLARSPITARAAAETAAQRRLSDRDVVCADLEVTLDVSDFRPGGDVAATVRCQVHLADLAGLDMPASMAFESTFAEPVDVFRGADR